LKTKQLLSINIFNNTLSPFRFKPCCNRKLMNNSPSGISASKLFSTPFSLAVSHLRRQTAWTHITLMLHHPYKC